MNEVGYMEIEDFDDDCQLNYDRAGNNEKDKRRLMIRRKLEERLEEKRLREEAGDDYWLY